MRRTIAALVLLGMAALVPAASAGASTGVPYTDPAETGLLTFCDAHGQRGQGRPALDLDSRVVPRSPRPLPRRALSE